jgi:hypothetical protein
METERLDMEMLMEQENVDEEVYHQVRGIEVSEMSIGVRSMVSKRVEADRRPPTLWAGHP